MALIGACVGTIAAEFLVMIYQTLKTRNQLEPRKYMKILIDVISKTLVMILLAYIFTFSITNGNLKMIMQIIISIIVFSILNMDFIKEFIGVKRSVKNEN